ncbi:6-phosphogluconate dehydrogenase, decarboxylating [Candidatus Blochmanniella vafra str. BVAF]|uniref:6-phosphogluconate dehydrogenase, decarboxylating n=1 Tax=Blochmanniella vafra (strain BVAF) TaxID=859654 RepID=E8Q733_BLOVB|nr:NADP-dependent phosphogluconate dehydrogenase [Candidatus Blochmannia vafer]ADV33857.1 6-phosphogluconate dehydrogenase, decarboxylating [Candidatus Blochmannia vafer str. BVAF]
MLKKQEIGVVGMGTMGRNLALNIESKGYNVAIYNRSSGKTTQIIQNNLKKNLTPYFSLEKFVCALQKPRLIFLMITSGSCVDYLIQSLLNYVDDGDVLIDGGNSFYKDTIRRSLKLLEKKIHFIGLGISGGEEGALKGPSLMPGGSKDAYDIISCLLKKIAARIDNEACVEYIGPNGSGHYVKMVHNGIEYGDMQIISEIYCFLKQVLCLTYSQLIKVFNSWNQGELNSYLMDITTKIFMKKDEETNLPVLEYILDVAGNKGTGAWSTKDALDLEIPVTMITEAVFARYLSMLKEQRVKASTILLSPINNNVNIFTESVDNWIEKARQALYLSKIILYTQGFYQLRVSSIHNNWNLNFEKIAKIFRSGCIIRSKFLQNIIDIYSITPGIENLLLAPYCVNIANKYQQSLREIVSCGISYGIAMPALSSAISYYDSYRSAKLPANLIQAQRDYFGAHTYCRLDKPGVFHTQWSYLD